MEGQEEQKLLLARADDAVRLCDLDGRPKFIGFLDEASAAFLRDYMKKKHADYLFYGGYPEAERVFFAALPDWCADPQEEYFPITPLTFTYRKGSGLSHRDFLGSLMALQLRREAIGDILIEDGRAVAFLSRETAPLVLSELRKVGSVGVSVSKGAMEPLPSAHRMESFSTTISSPRLDAVVAALAKTGRGEAARLIESGLVSIDALVCEKTTRTVFAGTVIKIRGKGKFKLSSLDDRTKKQRLILRYEQYV